MGLLEYLNENSDKIKSNNIYYKGCKKTIITFFESYYYYLCDILSIDSKTVIVQMFDYKDIGQQGKFDLSNSTKKRALIKVNQNLKVIDMLPIIAHEMVHVKQYQDGSIKTKNNSIFWKGNECISAIEIKSMMAKVRNNDIESYKEYINLPWEKPAFELEKKAFGKYVNSKNFQDLKSNMSEDEMKETINDLKTRKK